MKKRSTSMLRCLAAIIAFATTGPSQGQDLQFSPLQRLTNKEAVLTLNIPANGAYDILVSSNLLQWDALVTAFCTNSSLQHTDSAAPFLVGRFYKGAQLANTNAVTGDHVPTDAGDLVIHKGYHASFAMSWNNLMIYVDPTNRFLELPRADLVLLTHNHTDHFNIAAIAAVLKLSNTPIVTPLTNYNDPKFANYRPYATVLTNGQSTNLLGINIEAFPMYNTNASPPHAKGVGNGYVLTLGGKRIYLSGDTVNIPEMANLGNIDVAFLAMNQPYTMTVAQAVLAVRVFVPKIVYPNHYKGSPTTDLGSFKTQVLTNPGVEVRLRNWY